MSVRYTYIFFIVKIEPMIYSSCYETFHVCHAMLVMKVCRIWVTATHNNVRTVCKPISMYIWSSGTPFIKKVNFNPGMDKWLHPLWCVEWNYLSIPKPQRLHRWGLGMDKYLHLPLYLACDYLSMLVSKLNHVSKSGRSSQNVRISAINSPF